MLPPLPSEERRGAYCNNLELITTLIYRTHAAYSFKLHEIRQLNDIMEDTYDEWVANAPSGFFKNSFFRDSKPIIISCVVGQNQPICSPDIDSIRLEKRMWAEDRDYSKIKYFSLAIASHTKSVMSSLSCSLD
jgi:hypothetical protein